jgi:hypothetical protein
MPINDDIKADLAAQRIWNAFFGHGTTERLIKCEPERECVVRLAEIIREEFR